MSLTVNGVALNTLAWNVQNRSARWRVPGRRGANVPLPGVHGTLVVPGKPFDENTLVLNMWAVGCNTDGSFPASPSRARLCRDNLDTLTRLFTAPVLNLTETVDADIRQATGEVVTTIDHSSMAGGTRAEFSVEIVVPKAFWFDQSAVTQTLIPGSADATLAYTGFSAATAPLVDLTYEVTGPASNPTMYDPVTGQWVQLMQVLGAGVKWTLDSLNWTSTVGAANAIANTAHGIGATLLDLTPDATGPKLRITGASGASVKLTGKRGYLLA
jgi:hypothetical protein